MNEATRRAKFIKRFGTDFDATIREFIADCDEEPTEDDAVKAEKVAVLSVSRVIQLVQPEFGLRQALVQANLALVNHGDVIDRCRFLPVLKRRYIAAMAVDLIMCSMYDTLARSTH